MSPIAEILHDFRGVLNDAQREHIERKIRERLATLAKSERIEASCANWWWEEIRHEARAELLLELSQTL